MMLPRSMKSITRGRILHTATVRAFQSTAKKSFTIPFLPVLPQKPGGVKGTPNDAYVPPPENKLEGSYHWYMEKIFTLSVVPLATTAMLTTGPLSTAADSFFSVMLLGYCYMEFHSCVTDYISERVYGVWHKYAMYMLGLGSAVSLFGIYKLETENDGVVGLIKSLWGSSKRGDSEKIEVKK
ncbi:succinate dehydrogenase membrane anchor subunit SDH4 SKDI_04G3990 [Saccharomyces kudriavzevii IFO 1802]|uniref:Succinate dehydrogenase [ubiquinone] cytochrome b small subunit n=1 Tax=Saccharomyces kudriavzevii (strain ATCC MYA-4449 / AS 2.2408 / CBS 8840 / NBRC 1802 / NCYC 2889) TaxID=226230 RepID=A0AA35JG69_SACK1|nr:uncharacterized protein SKDI_04G3990 [Saccharomyces kudriavzevii IFO 1802]CAI4058407.1 hypothetical protein SKDI_04G3990 [Saccharomyces kudriavzevii IFO 1802]